MAKERGKTGRLERRLLSKFLLGQSSGNSHGMIQDGPKTFGSRKRIH